MEYLDEGRERHRRPQGEKENKIPSLGMEERSCGHLMSLCSVVVESTDLRDDLPGFKFQLSHCPAL